MPDYQIIFKLSKNVKNGIRGSTVIPPAPLKPKSLQRKLEAFGCKRA